MTSEYKGITNDQAAFAALGVFDGVHTGHRAVIEKVKEEAAMRNLSSAVISFRTHPQQVLHPEIPFRMLTSPEERAELLRKTGIDRTIFLDFTPEMSLLSAYDFLKILSNRYCIKGLIIGYDHRFGHNRAEGFEEYVKYGKDLGIEICDRPRAGKLFDYPKISFAGRCLHRQPITFISLYVARECGKGFSGRKENRISHG